MYFLKVTFTGGTIYEVSVMDQKEEISKVAEWKEFGINITISRQIEIWYPWHSIFMITTIKK